MEPYAGDPARCFGRHLANVKPRPHRPGKGRCVRPLVSSRCLLSRLAFGGWAEADCRATRRQMMGERPMADYPTTPTTRWMLDRHSGQATRG